MLNFNKFKAYYQKRSPDKRFTFCLAPYNGMHFSFNGKVYPCHNNNSFAYGSVGEKSLKDLWNSDSRILYQKHLKENKLEKVACLQCLKDVEQRNYEAVNALRYDAYPFDLQAAYPSVLGFRFSDNCNLSCIMCMSHHRVRQSTFDAAAVYDGNFFEELKPFVKHASFAYFLGGEPFFEPLNYKVFDMFAALNPGCRIAVQTNGMIWNDRIEGLIARGKYDINISVDSLKPDVYEQIRKGASFNKLEAHINNFRKYCLLNKTNLSSCITPMRLNWKEIPHLIDYFSSLSCKVWINKYYFPARYAIWSLDADDIKTISDELSNIIRINTEVSYNEMQFKGFIEVLNFYHKKALERKNDRKNHIRNLEKLLKEYEFFFAVYAQSSGTDMQSAFDVLSYIKKADNKKLYYYLKNLSAIFAGDKLAESFLMADKDFIAADIETLSV